VAIHSGDDLGVGRMRIFAEETERAQDHAWRTPAALHRIRVDERFLHRVKFPIRRQSFNRDHALARDGPDLSEARARCLPVDEDGAGCTLALAAAILRPGEVEVVAQDAQESALGIGVYLPFRPVDIKFGDPGHISSIVDQDARFAVISIVRSGIVDSRINWFEALQAGLFPSV